MIFVVNFDVEKHEPSFLPEGHKWKLVWNDEFDGDELDRSKWNFRLNFWGNRFPAYTEEGVVLDGKSNLEIHLIEKDGEYCSAQLQTGTNVFDYLNFGEKTGGFGEETEIAFWPFKELPKPTFLHSYGYYEVRCKFQKQPGWWSAFWLQAQTPGLSGDDPSYCGIEVDIIENFTRDGKVTSGNWFGSYTGDTVGDARVKYDVDPDEFHRFGVHWGKDGYVFYCDGKETARSTTGCVSKIPQFILLTTECDGYRHIPSQACEALRGAVLPDCFTVDYVRVFDEIE